MSLLLLVGLTHGAETALVAEATALDGVVWVGPDLLVGSPTEPGLPARRPLSAPGELGTIGDLSGYEPLGQACDQQGSWTSEAPAPEGRRAVLSVAVDLDGDGEQEQAVLHAGPRLEGPHAHAPLAVTVGEHTVELTEAALPCALRSWSREGRELLLVVWRSAGGSGWTQGLSVIGAG